MDAERIWEILFRHLKRILMFFFRKNSVEMISNGDGSIIVSLLRFLIIFSELLCIGFQ